MSDTLDIEKIFSMAEEIERNGAKFYRNAAEGISGSPNRSLLLELAEIEDQHEKTFATLKSQFSGNGTLTLASGSYEESGEYLRVLEDIRIFYEKEINVTSLEEILKTAIIAEKESIAFYLGMKNLIEEEPGKEKIDLIIKEEMGHIKLLSQKLAELKVPKPQPSFA